MKIFEATDRDFGGKMDAILSEARIAPTYGSVHADYYAKYTKTGERVSGLVVATGDKPVLGLLYTHDRDGRSSGYFGMPALVVSRPYLPKVEERRAWELIDVFVHQRMEKDKNFKLLIDYETAKTQLFDEILKVASNCSIRFARVLDLEIPEQNWSKSVKTASKKAERSGVVCVVRDIYSSNSRDLEKGLEELRMLHLQASGRETRTLDTWQAQLQSLVNGSATLVTSYQADGPISSALFIHSLGDVYYAVSASQNSTDAPKGHVVMRHAIEHFKERKFKRLHLGSQYSHLVCQVSEKESGIEKFKALFGGHLNYYFLVTIL